MFSLSKPITVSSMGRYEAFTVAESNGSQILSMWRSARPQGHAIDPDLFVRSAVMDFKGKLLEEPRTAFSGKLLGTPPVAPAGLAWDAATKRWIVLGLETTYNSEGTKIIHYGLRWVTSPDAKVWTISEPLPIQEAAWIFASDLKIVGKTWVVTAYGSFRGSTTTEPMVNTSTDGGATWTGWHGVKGLPTGIKYFEPQVIRHPELGWFMAIRNNVDTIMMARSADGITWNYSGIAVVGVSGEPELGITTDGTLVMLLRQQPLRDDTHGEWAMATSTDGVWWDYSTEWPDDGRFMMYGALAQVPGGSMIAVYASEDDVNRMWGTSSIMALRLDPAPVGPVAPVDPPLPSEVPLRSSWRYLGFRMNGDGTESMVSPELPLDDVELTPTLSGVPGFKASIPVEMPTLTDSKGDSLLVPWSTVIYPEQSGVIRGGYIISDITENGPKLDITGVGFTGYSKNTPYQGERTWVNGDALDITRHVWDHIQSQPGSNIGLQLEQDKSGELLGRLPTDQWMTIREGQKTNLLPVGTPFKYVWVKTPAKPAVTRKTTKLVNKKRVTTVKTTPAKPAVTVTLYGRSTREYTLPKDDHMMVLWNTKTRAVWRDEGGNGTHPGYERFGFVTKNKPKEDTEGVTLEPYKLAWYADHDLASKLDDLAAQGNFDWWEDHRWNGDRVEHFLRFSVPRAGRVRNDLRFVLGENVIDYPTVEKKSDNTITEVSVLGAGEGRAMIRGTWISDRRGKLRRVHTVTDKTITTRDAANRRAAEVGRALTGFSISSLTVRNHPNAPLGSWSLGDTITYLQPNQGWSGLRDYPGRVVSYTINPDKDTSTITLVSPEGDIS